MKLVMFETADRAGVGVLTEGGVLDLGELVPGGEPHAALVALIDGFDELRPAIEARLEEGAGGGARLLALDAVALRPSVPEPGKVLCVMRNRPALYATPRPYAYLKYAEGGVGPGDVLCLPGGGDGLRHEGEIAAVVRGPARNVARSAWREAVFGFTGFLDVVGPSSIFSRPTGVEDWAKSWSTPWAVGPCLVTADAVPDPGRGLTLRVSTRSGTVEVRDPGRPAIPELVEFLTSVMTLRTGDVIACGAHQAAVADAAPGSRVELDLPAIGTLAVQAGM